jgi:hypothetical protein
MADEDLTDLEIEGAARRAAEVKAAGMEGALKLERLFHAQTALDLWRERYSHAATQIDRWEREVKKRQAISRGEAVP